MFPHPPAHVEDRHLLAEPGEEQPMSFSHCHLPGKEKPSDLDVPEPHVTDGGFLMTGTAPGHLSPHPEPGGQSPAQAVLLSRRQGSRTSDPGTFGVTFFP